MNSRSRKLWAKHLSGFENKASKSNPSSLLKKQPYVGRVVGIDPSLRGTGLAVLECTEKSYTLLHSETLKLTSKVSSVECLGEIHKSVSNLVQLSYYLSLSLDELNE